MEKSAPVFESRLHIQLENRLTTQNNTHILALCVVRVTVYAFLQFSSALFTFMQKETYMVRFVI